MQHVGLGNPGAQLQEDEPLVPRSAGADRGQGECVSVDGGHSKAQMSQ